MAAIQISKNRARRATQITSHTIAASFVVGRARVPRLVLRQRCLDGLEPALAFPGKPLRQHFHGLAVTGSEQGVEQFDLKLLTVAMDDFEVRFFHHHNFTVNR